MLLKRISALALRQGLVTTSNKAPSSPSPAAPHLPLCSDEFLQAATKPSHCCSYDEYKQGNLLWPAAGLLKPLHTTVLSNALLFAP